MQHLMTLRVYKHREIAGAYWAIFRCEVSNDCRAMVFTERTRAMEYCKAQLMQYMQMMPFSSVHMRQVVRKGVWCYNVFGIDRNEMKQTSGSLWALQRGGKT